MVLHPRGSGWKKASDHGDLICEQPFTLKKHRRKRSISAMMRLGLHLPPPSVPYKNPPTNARYAYTAIALQTIVDLDALASRSAIAGHEALRRRRRGGVTRNQGLRRMHRAYDESAAR